MAPREVERRLDRGELSLGEYVALAFVAVEPIHGYEVARRWAQSVTADLYPAEQSVVYGYLRSLERRELLDWNELKVGNRPPRRIYELNEDGWSVLRSWLRSPVQRLREVRADFLLRWYFLEQIDPRAISALLEGQVRACEEYVNTASARLVAAEGFERHIAASRLSAAEATLAWLRHAAPSSGDRAAS